MVQRKIISFGTNSYVVSLPTNWINKKGLVKGDSVNVIEKSDEIIINPGMKKEVESSFTINISGRKLSAVRAELVTAYLRGYDSITMTGEGIMSNISEFRYTVSLLPGIEIMHLTSDSMKLKNLLNESNVSIEEIIQRVNNMIVSMLNDTVDFPEKKTSSQVYERDREINRMVFLSFRVLRKAFGNSVFAREINLEPVDISIKWLVILRLEKIGDQVKRISRFMEDMDRSSPEGMKKLYKMIFKQYNSLMEAYRKNDKDSLLELMTEGKQVIMDECNRLLEKENDKPGLRIIENFKNMASTIQHIAQSILTIA
ncbi:MAG: AbrB/MazE/SpoVT family DNA-binding domain-containing protein [Nanobdellota archaeon]